jgi:hypothetical protein
LQLSRYRPQCDFDVCLDGRRSARVCGFFLCVHDYTPWHHWRVKFDELAAIYQHNLVSLSLRRRGVPRTNKPRTKQPRQDQNKRLAQRSNSGPPAEPKAARGRPKHRPRAGGVPTRGGDQKAGHAGRATRQGGGNTQATAQPDRGRPPQSGAPNTRGSREWAGKDRPKAGHEGPHAPEGATSEEKREREPAPRPREEPRMPRNGGRVKAPARKQPIVISRYIRHADGASGARACRIGLHPEWLGGHCEVRGWSCEVRGWSCEVWAGLGAAKKCKKSVKKCKIICIYGKFFVPLHRIWK